MNVFSPDGRPLHHVAIAVPSIDGAAALYERLAGTPCSEPETVSGQGVRVSFCGQVELIEPLAADTTVGRFIERRGPGLHHIAYLSKDLAEDLRLLAEADIELIDSEPRPGAGGHLVAFLHPRSTGGILVELVQHPD
jgi:methylmalonyl-CoA/ethylmalonyl-CoA epimerase